MIGWMILSFYVFDTNALCGMIETYYYVIHLKICCVKLTARMELQFLDSILLTHCSKTQK